MVSLLFRSQGRPPKWAHNQGGTKWNPISGSLLRRPLMMFLAGAFFALTWADQMLPALVEAWELDLYTKVQEFTWKEFYGGSRLLEESGLLYSLAGELEFPVRRFAVWGRGEAFGGSIDYRGQTWGGEPVRTDANYFGLKGEGDLGWRALESRQARLIPFAGLGYWWWLRDLESTGEATGYLENWSSLYLRLGGRGDYQPLFAASLLRLFAQAALILPLYNENRAYLGEVGLRDVSLHPGRRPSLSAEAGLRLHRVRVSVFYQGLRFSKSRAVTVEEGLAVLQPRSRADLWGVAVGASF